MDVDDAPVFNPEVITESGDILVPEVVPEEPPIKVDNPMPPPASLPRGRPKSSHTPPKSPKGSVEKTDGGEDERSSEESGPTDSGSKGKKRRGRPKGWNKKPPAIGASPLAPTGNELILGQFQPGSLLVGDQWQAFLDKINCYACGGEHDDDKIILCDSPHFSLISPL